VAWCIHCISSSISITKVIFVALFFLPVALTDRCLSLWTERPSREWLVDDGIAVVRCLQLIPATGRYSNESFSRTATEGRTLCVHCEQLNELNACKELESCLPGFVNM
jgi:hypothetical protein